MAVIEYKCPACGAPIAFEPGKQQLACSHCGSSYSIEDLETSAEKTGVASDDEISFDWENFKDKIQDQRLTDTVTYNCKSCGAIVETDENTVATRCPYCDNNVLISERTRGGLRPNAIIPFKITSKALPEAVNSFYKNKKLLPKNFFSESKLREIQGVYVPFWLFGAHVEGELSLNAQRSISFDDGDYIVTETSHFILEREGSMNFARIPVDASVKMDNDLMDSVEPYDYRDLVPFSGAYLSGYLADKFDSPPDEELYRARTRMVDTIKNELTSSAGYIVTGERGRSLKFSDIAVEYVMLPVYLINNEYKGKKYRYAVNGQTGKVVGELPIAMSKYWRRFFTPFVIIFALIALYLVYVFFVR